MITPHKSKRPYSFVKMYNPALASTHVSNPSHSRSPISVNNADSEVSITHPRSDSHHSITNPVTQPSGAWDLDEYESSESEVEEEEEEIMFQRFPVKVVSTIENY